MDFRIIYYHSKTTKNSRFIVLPEVDRVRYPRIRMRLERVICTSQIDQKSVKVFAMFIILQIVFNYFRCFQHIFGQTTLEL